MKTMNQEMLDKRVAAGAQLLDENQGKGWEAKIDLNTLQMESRYSCILGQLFGDFNLGCQVLGRDKYADTDSAYLDWPFEYGFEAEWGGILQAAWVRFIEKSRRQ